MANQVTPRGLHVICQWERWRSKAYMDGFRKDGSPIRSKGFGHSDQLTTVPFDDPEEWSEAYSREVLLKDLDYFGDLLRPHLKIEVPDEIWSVCLSLVYNKGVSRLVKSEQWAILHDGGEYHLERFCESILKYAIMAHNKVTGVLEEKRGLRWRRIAESAIFMQDRSKDYL